MNDYKNRKALYNYTTKENFVAGICLTGWAVKSIRAGKVDIKDAFVKIHEGCRAVVHNLKITPLLNSPSYFIENTDEFQLLLTKKEIHRLWVKQQEGGIAMPVLRLFAKNGRFKLEFSLAVGKKVFDKKRFEKKREWERKTKE